MSDQKKYPMTAKRILAWAAIVILVLLYVVTLICALIGTPFARGLFYASLFSTFFVPVMMWVFLLTVRLVKGAGSADEEQKL